MKKLSSLAIMSCLLLSSSFSHAGSYIMRAGISDIVLSATPGEQPATPPGEPTPPEKTDGPWRNAGDPICGEWLPGFAGFTILDNFLQSQTCTQSQERTLANGSNESRSQSQDNTRNIEVQKSVATSNITNPTGGILGTFVPLRDFSPTLTNMNVFINANWAVGTTSTHTRSAQGKEITTINYLYDGNVLSSGIKEETKPLTLVYTGVLESVSANGFSINCDQVSGSIVNSVSQMNESSVGSYLNSKGLVHTESETCNKDSNYIASIKQTPDPRLNAAPRVITTGFAKSESAQVSTTVSASPGTSWYSSAYNCPSHDIQNVADSNLYNYVISNGVFITTDDNISKYQIEETLQCATTIATNYTFTVKSSMPGAPDAESVFGKVGEVAGLAPLQYYVIVDIETDVFGMKYLTAKVNGEVIIPRKHIP